MIDSDEIINRGYVTVEEYNWIFKNCQLEKIKLKDDNSEFSEGIWVYPLESSGACDKNFYFVFFNDPIMFLGMPRPVAGMVGVARSNGEIRRATASASTCLDLFKKTGTEAIKYFQNIR